MHWRAKAIFDVGLARALDGFGRHAMPGDRVASHAIGWGDLNGGMDHVGYGTTVRPAKWIAVAPRLAASVNWRESVYRGYPVRAVYKINSDVRHCHHLIKAA
jgi:hypothetical protein